MASEAEVAVRDVTHEPFHWTPAVKRGVGVKAVRITGPFKVTTREGDVLRQDGGWLIEAEDGRRWPVDDAYFAKHYRPLEPSQPFHPIFGRDGTPEEYAVIDDLKQAIDKARVLVLARAPSNRERSLAVTALEDAAMRATRAVLMGDGNVVFRGSVPQ